MIRLAIDFKNALSWLSLGPTRAMAEELGVPLELLPYQTEVSVLTEARKEETVAERHARVRAEYYADDLKRYAKLQNLELVADSHGVDSTMALLGLLWGNQKGVGLDYAHSIFSRFWSDSMRLDDVQSIGEILTLLSAPGFEPGAMHEELNTVRATLEAEGVFSVPMYLVEGQVFQGREHLPMIRWLLAGERESVPI
ncbi:MAG: DsbA family protein [Pseudomonadales bacterium]|nr:DsbA family protein [Pseudomonadales bacterium]